MSEEKKGIWREKSLNLRISTEEHRAIKTVAFEKEITIKELIFKALDSLEPDWRGKGKK